LYPRLGFRRTAVAADGTADTALAIRTWLTRRPAERARASRLGSRASARSIIGAAPGSGHPVEPRRQTADRGGELARGLGVLGAERDAPRAQERLGGLLIITGYQLRVGVAIMLAFWIPATIRHLLAARALVGDEPLVVLAKRGQLSCVEKNVGLIGVMIVLLVADLRRRLTAVARG
jgi:hypothetical protein